MFIAPPASASIAALFFAECTLAQVYLDHNSTTILDPEVARELAEALRAGYANPASQHGPGREARRALAAARERIMGMLGANVGVGGDRLVFTSGGTEANNLAVFGLCGRPPASILISSIEHPSIVRSAAKLQALGFELRRIPVNTAGVIDLNRLAGLIDGTTRLVCLMLANNETGVIQPVQQAAEICRRAGVWLHTDAVQAIGKTEVDFGQLGVSSLALGAHKFNGPRGIGALLLRPEIPLAPILFGGSQQFSLRPGTEDVALAIGLCAALAQWQAHGEARRTKMLGLREGFESRLQREVPDTVIVGQGSPRLPQTCQVAFPGINRQSLFMAADLQGLALSTGSACASGSSEPSPTLSAMGLSEAIVEGAVRVSFGFQTTEFELEFAADQIVQIVRNFREKTARTEKSRPSRLG